MEYKNLRSAAEYIAEYSDNESFRNYRRANLTGTEMPPISFLADGKPSSAFKWTKKIGAIATYTDFPTDGPVKRDERTDVYTCEELGIEVSVTFAEYPLYPVIEYLPKIKNISKKNSPEITELYSLNGCVTNDVYCMRVHHNNGGSYITNEYADLVDELRPYGGQNKLIFDNRNGLCSSDHVPCFNFENVDHNKGVICAVSWSADWKLNLEINKRRETMVKAGQRITDFVLLPGEEVRMPLMVLLFYRGNRMCGQNIWRHWYFNHNVLRAQGKRMRTNLLYCISSDDNGMLNNEQQNFDSIKLAVKLKLNKVTDYINQDAGWYNVREGYGWDHTGNWYPDPVRYPNGLKPVADMAHKHGMLYSVWFEPERLRTGTKAFKDLGEDALFPKTREDGKLVLAKPEEVPDGEHLLTNYANPRAVEYTINWIDKIIKENGIDQYRQDQNFGAIAHYFEAADNTEEEKLGVKRAGVCEAKFVAGYHAMWTGLLKRNPNLVIDACSGGGRRNDIETVRQSFIHTRTDYLNDSDFAQCQTYGMSMWYMLMGTASIRMEDEYDRRSRIASSLGYLPSEGAWEKVFKRADKLWRGYMENFFSNYYPLTPYTCERDGNLAMQFDNIDAGTGFICCYIRKSGTLTLKPCGLCPDDTYEYYNEDSPKKKVRVKGLELMENGITVGSPKKAAIIINYKRV